jgi:hypothetical protein
MCSARISEQTAIISPYSINLSVFITEEASVYCAVRTGSQTDTVSSLKGLSQSSMTAHSEANITHSKREHTKPLFYALVVFVKNERKSTNILPQQKRIKQGLA